MEINEFVSKFHNLPGKDLPEKQKNINILLRDIPSDHDAFLNALVPKTHFENMFKLKILLKLQRIPELLQILKHEEEYLPIKLLKNKWFCQKLASILDEDPSDFVNGLLPFTSYVIRKRIITKLATFGNRLDPVFDEVCDRYGIHIATDLLIGCTPTKIEQVLKNDKVKLSPHHQKLLYQKYPQVFALYRTQESIDESVMHYMVSHNIDNVLELVEEFKNLGPHLGKRLTKKLLTHRKENVVAKAEYYCRLLHLRTLRKNLKKEEMNRFIFNATPPEVENLKYGAGLGLSSMKKLVGNQCYQLLSQLIQEKYKKSIYDFPDFVEDEDMESMDISEREKWISVRRKKGFSENNLIQFMQISDSISLIKSKINVTSSVSTRSVLIELLVKTCKINNDYKALTEVCKYICSRHKNDDPAVLRQFIYTLQLRFPFEKFDAQIWDSINTILNILNKNDDHSWFKNQFYIKYVEFLFGQKKLTDKEICEFLKLCKQEQFTYKTTNEELRKILLLKTIEILPQIIKKEDSVEYEDVELIGLIFQWNQDHPEDKISFMSFSRLVESLKKSTKIAIESDCQDSKVSAGTLGTIFEKIICTKEEPEVRNECIREYLLFSFAYCNLNIDFWLLKHEPEIIYTNAEQFLNHLFHDNCINVPIMTYIKKYTDANFLEKIVQFCLNKIQQDENSELAFQILAILEPPNKFLEHIVPFYPPDDEIRDQQVERKGNMALAVAKSFKYSSYPVLPVLIEFCKGDLKNNSLQSLYFLFYHSPENQLSIFIESLSLKAVSVRKHAIFLTCIVGTIEDVKKLLQKFIDTETNVSVQKHLFIATLNFFIKNPSDHFWDFVKICMTKLHKNDSESYSMLTNLRLIPERYQSRHVIFVWEILKKCGDSDKNRPRLLSSIPERLFANFPLNFLLEVISENFLKSGSSCEDAVHNFIASSLTKSGFKNEIMEAVFDNIQRLKNTKYDSLEEEKNVRNSLYDFVNSVTSTLASDETSWAILPIFAQKWHCLFSADEAIREHLKLSFAQFYIESGKDLAKFTTSVAEFLENIVSIYSVVIISCFAIELKDFFRAFLGFYTDFNRDIGNFTLNLVTKWNGLIFYLLAIELLPLKEPSEPEEAELFRRVFKILRDVPEKSIQMLMNLYVMNME